MSDTIRRDPTSTTGPLRNTGKLPENAVAQPAAGGTTGGQPAAGTTGGQPAATGDSRVASGATPPQDRVQSAIAGTGSLPAGADVGSALAARRARENPPSAEATQRAQQAAAFADQTRSDLGILNYGTANPAAVARTASLLARPDQIQSAREALQPIAHTDQGKQALAKLDETQRALEGNRAGIERKMGQSLHNALRTNQSLAGIPSEQGRADLAAFAGRDPANKAAFDRLAQRPAQSGEFDAGRAANTDPAAVATRERAMLANPREAAGRDEMVRQAVQGLADKAFGRVDAGGNGNVADANKALDAGIQRLRDAGVDGAALDRARQAVTSDPSNQVMLQNPGHDALGRLAVRTGVTDMVAGQVNSFFDNTVGPRVEGQKDDAGLLSHVTERIPPGESRTVALEGQARFGAVELGAGASMTVARTQPTGTPPSTKLQVTFSVNASAAAGFQKEFGKSGAVGGVSGQVEVQARVDGKASFTYEFDTGNPQHMAQLAAMGGAVVRAIPGGTAVAGTEGPGVQEAFKGLSERHVETKYEAAVTATARVELTASASEKSAQLVARFQQAQAGYERAQAIGGSLQEAAGALGKTPPDFQAAFTSMQGHLPPGVVKAGQVAQDAAKAQQLYSEGKTAEALQIMKGYMPQGLQNAAAVATDASRAYSAMNAGNVSEAFEIMKGHLPAGAQAAGQLAQDAQKAQQLYNEGKTDEAMGLLRGHLPAALQGASQVALDGFRAQEMVRNGDAAGAFNLMQQHLPAGAQRTGQAAQDAQKAQQLVSEGKTTEALALLTPYMPAGVANTVGQAQAGLAAYNAVQSAFERGDMAGGLAAMGQAAQAAQGMAGALRAQVAELPGQIAAAKAAVQTLREMPAQLRDQIQSLPAQAREQVQGLLSKASEQVQGLRAQAAALQEQAAKLPESAKAQAIALREQASQLTNQARTQARELTQQARNLPATVRQGVMDRINAATAAPAAEAGPIGSVQLTGSVSARVGQSTNYRDNSTTTTFGLTAQGTAAAESRVIGQTGTSGARSADIAVTRGADGTITGVTVTRSFEGSTFAATAGRELVGDLDPQVIASVQASDRVAVTQQIDLNAAGITPGMSSAEVARRLAVQAMRNPTAGSGPISRVTATRTESVQARADFVVGSVAVRVDRTRERELRPSGT